MEPVMGDRTLRNPHCRKHEATPTPHMAFKRTPKQLHLPYCTRNFPPLSETGRSLLGWKPLFFPGCLLAFHVSVRIKYQRHFTDLSHGSHRSLHTSLPSAFMVDSFKFRATVVHNHSQDVSCKVLHCFGSLVGTVPPGVSFHMCVFSKFPTSRSTLQYVFVKADTSHPVVRTVPPSSPIMESKKDPVPWIISTQIGSK